MHVIVFSSAEWGKHELTSQSAVTRFKLSGFEFITYLGWFLACDRCDINVYYVKMKVDGNQAAFCRTVGCFFFPLGLCVQSLGQMCSQVIPVILQPFVLCLSSYCTLKVPCRLACEFGPLPDSLWLL